MRDQRKTRLHSQKLPQLEAEERYATGIGGPTSAAELRRMALGPETRNVQVAKAVYSFGVTRGFSFRCTNSQDGNGAGTIKKVEGVALVQWRQRKLSLLMPMGEDKHGQCIGSDLLEKDYQRMLARLRHEEGRMQAATSWQRNSQSSRLQARI